MASLALAVLVFGLPVGSSFAWAQEPSPAVVTHEGKLDRQALLEALRPRSSRPLQPRTLTTVASERRSCAKYRERINRGFAVEPVSEEVNLTLEFASDSAELTASARGQLDVLGSVLGTGDLAHCCFKIEGHTDSQNTDAYNMALSARRTESVIDYLVDRVGIERDRLTGESFGESDPAADNDTEEGRQRNRRVVVGNMGFETAEGGG